MANEYEQMEKTLKLKILNMRGLTPDRRCELQSLSETVLEQSDKHEENLYGR